jgi:Ni/Co efflux regulator RcnB
LIKEAGMKRVLSFVVAAAFALVPLTAAAADSKKTKTAAGTVTAVTDTSVSVKSGTNEMKFSVDKDTKLTARGGSTKMAAAKKEGKTGLMVTDIVGVGDKVTVKYHEMEGGMLHAASIRVNAKASTD